MEPDFKFRFGLELTSLNKYGMPIYDTDNTDAKMWVAIQRSKVPPIDWVGDIFGVFCVIYSIIFITALILI